MPQKLKCFLTLDRVKMKIITFKKWFLEHVRFLARDERSAELKFFFIQVAKCKQKRFLTSIQNTNSR
jgi:hypothetical protein